ncbi:hypothetical protein PLICRDRAFT_306878 [Plicaturopsis crispa FD-325 SS-3]|nr:hypothetical protein PLICRDRAFT_306878 [Plicaturopsis crispa FD-325 SS-3]
MPSALILGATGQTGQHVLKVLLASKYFTHVGEYGRRLTPLDEITVGKDKLEQKIIDFEKIEESGLKDKIWDVVFITLGTSRKNAGSAEAFERIDREYVLNAARAARTEGADQRVVYVSSAGANASSSFLYTKSKGLTEQGLASLGYKDAIIFRPGFLVGTHRPKFRPLEYALGCITGPLSYISSSLEINVSLLGKAVVNAGRLGSAALPSTVGATKDDGADGNGYTVIGNAGALDLAKVVE